jgi:CheY-like chemotaxis protein
MALPPNARINLERTVVLLVDDNPQALEAVAGMLRGFGVRKMFKCASAKEAQERVETQEIDLIVVDTAMPQMDGYDFVRWLRTEAKSNATFIPVIMMSGHTGRGVVEKGRDCGTNFVLAKPFKPEVLLERILWVSKDQRQMVKVESYTGPDRRFKNTGPPPDTDGRRHDDLSIEVGKALDPNLGQSDIDSLFKPTKVQL